MSIPKFDDFFLPFLQFLGDGKEHPIKEVIEHLCDRCKLTEEERSLQLPSGKQLVVNNRAGRGEGDAEAVNLLNGNWRDKQGQCFFPAPPW